MTEKKDTRSGEAVTVVFDREAAETIAWELGGALAAGADHGITAYNRGADALRSALTQQHSGDDRITMLGSLEKGWDSYDGEPPTEEAMETLRGFNRALAYVPLATGGVQVEFHALGLDFEVEIGPEGAVEDYDLQPSRDSLRAPSSGDDQQVGAGEQCRCADVARGRLLTADENQRNACRSCGGLLWDPAPPSQVAGRIVYRGHRPAFPDGGHYTEDPDLAERWRAQGEVVTAFVPPSQVGQGLSAEDRERLNEIADELDPPVRLPGPVPFKSEVAAVTFLRKLAASPPGLLEKLEAEVERLRKAAASAREDAVALPEGDHVRLSHLQRAFDLQETAESLARILDSERTP